MIPVAKVNRNSRQRAAAKAQESSQALHELRGMLSRARAERPHWYTWIADGCQPLTEAEYAAARRGDLDGQPIAA